jgi:hypothetical protein
MNSDQLRQLYKDHKVIIVTTPNQTESPSKNDEPKQPTDQPPTDQPLSRLIPSIIRPPIQPVIRPPIQLLRRGGCCGKRA